MHISLGNNVSKDYLELLLDRIDINGEVPSVASSQSDIICNADMHVEEIRQFCKLQDEGQNLMRAEMSQLNLSARLIAES